MDVLVQIDRKGLLGVEPTRDVDQRLCEFVLDLPVPRFVGIGQHTAADLATDSRAVKLGGLRA